MAENHDIGARRQSVILSQEPSDENVLRAAIDAACYTAGDIQTKTCEKKELFPFLKKQSVIFEEPPSGGFSRAIWLEYANRQTFKGDESGEFPHEVGLFLSYPPEDVKGFIDHRANNFKCTGPWKVYGDEEKARSLFAKYKKCTEIYCALWQSGSKLEQLAVAV